MKLVLRGNLIFEFDESLTSQPTGERENQQAGPSFWTILCSFNENINTKMKRCTQKYKNMVNKNTKANIWMNNRAFHKNRILVIHIELSQGDFNCGASSKADFILNYFLSKFLNFPKISSNFLKQLKPPFTELIPVVNRNWYQKRYFSRICLLSFELDPPL